MTRVRSALFVALLLGAAGCTGNEDSVPEADTVPDGGAVSEVQRIPDALPVQPEAPLGGYLTEAELEECPAVGADPLPSDALLAAGTYRVVFVSEGRGIEGQLTLEPDERADGRILRGSADMDLNAVGAVTQGDWSSTDPDAPGVLVFRLPEASPGDGPRILLRFGSELNREGSRLMDGSTLSARVHQVTGDGFDALWESRGFNLQLQGHLCAERVEG